MSGKLSEQGGSRREQKRSPPPSVVLPQLGKMAKPWDAGMPRGDEALPRGPRQLGPQVALVPHGASPESFLPGAKASWLTHKAPSRPPQHRKGSLFVCLVRCSLPAWLVSVSVCLPLRRTCWLQNSCGLRVLCELCTWAPAAPALARPFGAPEPLGAASKPFGGSAPPRCSLRHHWVRLLTTGWTQAPLWPALVTSCARTEEPLEASHAAGSPSVTVLHPAD